ncbi:hypothetical protein BGZ60DRAFT_559957 [Tricladium varicosporioides]|nr:hypothetical protein BGZ60DRAFT_559957 [Hymenoscyphus varicosporioides]
MDTQSIPTPLGRFDSFEVIDDLNQGAVDDKGDSNTATGKQDNDSDSKVSPPDERGRSVRPTYTRMSRRWLSPSVLNRYKIEYVFENENPDFILIKRWVPEYEQDFLWAATKEDRIARELERKEFERRRMGGLDETLVKEEGRVEGEAKVLMVSSGKRGEDLKLEINRVPMRAWRKFRRGELSKKHVLDVAMEPPHPTSPTVDPSDTTIDPGSVPVRLAINSSHIAQELSRIGDINFQPGSVIIAPWKPLVVHHDAILQRFQELNELQKEKSAVKSEEDKATPKAESEGKPSETISPSEHKVDINAAQTKPEPVPVPCKVCELTYPPHDVPLECLEVRISHLKCLIDFLDDLKPVISLRKHLASATTKDIEFSDLYHLFNPGDNIFSPNYRQVYRVFHTSGGRPLLSKPVGFYKRPVITPFRIDCFYIDFDRTTLGPVYEMITIPPFDGKRQVTSIIAEFMKDKHLGKVPIFPTSYLDDWEDVKQDLVQRGRKLKGFGDLAHKRYDGAPVTDNGPFYQYYEVNSDERWDMDRRRRQILPLLGESPDYVAGDIMIDFEKEGKFINTQFPMTQSDWRETADGCRHYGPTNFVPTAEMAFRSDCSCSEIFLDNYIDKRRAELYKKDAELLKVRHPDDVLTDEHFMLLPSVITSFVLEKRRWMQLFVDRILDLEWEKEDGSKRESQLDDLVIPEGYFDVLESLISAQPNTRLPRGVESSARGNSLENTSKGRQGLIILLHGDSGTGKHSTVEAIASSTRRPLYQIPLNKAPADAVEMGEYLKAHLSRAQDWNSITVLSDIESVVSKVSPKKSNPTSLCQIIDSHRGVLIITAKYADSIPHEVLSRIHIPLHFPRFDQDVALGVWESDLDTLKDGGLVKLDEKAKAEILTFANSEYVRGARWDGRQIRNCLHTAITLAKRSSGKQSPEMTIQEPASLTLKAVESAAKLMSSLVLVEP